MTEASYIAGAKRTAVAPTGGAFKEMDLHELGSAAAMACLDDTGLAAEDVDEIVAGNALGAGGNPARHVALALGLESVGGLTLDRQCCGGLDALILADALVRSGKCRVVLAGGVESFSRRPFRSMPGSDGGEPEPYEQAPFTPWKDRDPGMAEAAEALAARCGISREAQDRWTVESHMKAIGSRERIELEIAPLGSPPQTFDSYSRSLSYAACARSRPLRGSITRANTSAAADAASFCAVVSEEIAERLAGRHPRIVDGITVGADPMLPGLAPVPAIRQLLRRNQFNAEELACAEINEAYAVQAIACIKEAGLDPDSVNVGGGSLARGHPIGASGAILAVRLRSELARRPGIGLAAIAAAGGLGTAVLLEV